MTEETMSIDERYKYLRKMQKRYFQADRKTRSALLTEMEQVTELHRKSLLRLLHSSLRRKKRRRQRGFTYGTRVRDAVKLCAEALDFPAAERLQPVLLQTAQALAHHGHLHFTPEMASQLQRISVSTVRRIVGPVTRIPQRIAAPRKPTRARNRKHGIPIRTLENIREHPGCLEADTVSHSGPEARGQFAHTLCLTDVATGWVSTHATLGNSALVMKDAFQGALRRIPFPMGEIHFDNGTEFLNSTVVPWLKGQGCVLSRSRPFHKNDNRFVEENNNSHIRAYVGHDRYDTVAQVMALNTLYPLLDLYHNLFLPVMRTTRDADGKKQVVVQAPFQHLLATGVLSDEDTQRWQTFQKGIDPLGLKAAISKTLKALAGLPGASPGQVEDVRGTLEVWKKGITLTSYPLFPHLLRRWSLIPRRIMRPKNPSDPFPAPYQAPFCSPLSVTFSFDNYSASVTFSFDLTRGAG